MYTPKKKMLVAKDETIMAVSALESVTLKEGKDSGKIVVSITFHPYPTEKCRRLATRVGSPPASLKRSNWQQ